MKTIQEIREEYQKTPIMREIITSPLELSTYLEVLRDDLLDDFNEIKDIRRQNQREERIERILFKIASLFGEYDNDEEFYKEENRLLKEEQIMTLNWRHYYDMIEKTVTEENLEDCLRLADFLHHYYEKNTDSLEAERKQNNLRSKGVSFYSPKIEDTRKIIDQFVTEIIEELSTKRNYQKQK